MNEHNIVAFVGPGLALCDGCHQVLDVYEWSDPCPATPPERSEVVIEAQAFT